MKKCFYLFVFVFFLFEISLAQTNQHIWTFDCGTQQWAEFNHSREFIANHEPANEIVNSGHLEFTHQSGSTEDWLFGPTNLSINADVTKHIHFSLTLNDCGEIPEAGINALLVWTPASDMSVLYTKIFQIFSGQRDYHIDLSEHIDWIGNININRIHFPSGDYTGNGYTPVSAVFALDWFAVTSEASFSTPTQDTTSACIPELVELSAQTSVTVNGASVVINSEMISGNMASLKVEYNLLNGAKQTKEYGNVENGVISAGLSLLEFGTEYEYSLIATNDISADTVNGTFSIENIITEAELWSFDCWYDGWKGHSVDLEHVYLEKNGALKFSNINAGSFVRNQGFSVNATSLKNMLIGVSVENAPSHSITGRLSNKTRGGEGFNFTWEPADSVIRVDLTEFSLWDGNIDHVWIYLVQNAPSDMVINIDWIAFSNNPYYYPEEQQSACAPDTPVLSNPETVVFGNRASTKANLSGGFGNARIKLWKAGVDTITMRQVVSEKTGVYFSFYDLELNTEYSWQIDITNPDGTYFTDVQNFTTEETASEEMPMKYWMTPSPFKLIENVNDHLFDQSNWDEAAGLVDVYKIHGAYFNSLGDFDRLNLTKLIFTINKYRMRLAWETIVQGDRNGAAYAGDILQMIEKIGDVGGKLEFLTWDGMMFRCFYESSTDTQYRTPEEGLEAVAEAARIVKAQYPDFEIIPLPNLPNWDFKNIPHNAGDWAGKTGVPSWDYLCDIYLQKASQKGVKTNFIEIDHPFNYYHSTSRVVSAQRISSIYNYCEDNDMDLIIIINTSGITHTSSEMIDAQFKEDCLQYIEDLREDGIYPKYIDVESWYPYPQYLTPDTKENSFTNVLRDVGEVFFNPPTGINTLQPGSSELENILVYPNPASHNLSLVIPENINKVSVRLFDIHGKVHKTIPELRTGSHTISVENLIDGLYFMQLISGDDIVVHKLLKMGTK